MFEVVEKKKLEKKEKAPRIFAKPVDLFLGDADSASSESPESVDLEDNLGMDPFFS
jgi:hypothetical protein